MPCEHFQNAIVEIAASGVEPQGELRTHLNGCADCRTAFAAERSLFISIDSGLQVTANSVVPPAFLHRVHARILQENFQRRGWFLPRPLLVGAIVAVAVVLLAVVVKRGGKIPKEKEEVATAVTHSTATPEHKNPESVGIPPSVSASFVRHPAMVSKPSNDSATPNRNVADVEVLVPHDQEVLLANYAAELQRRHSAPLIAARLNDIEPAPLQVDLIQIAQLDVKPLTEEQAK